MALEASKTKMSIQVNPAVKTSDIVVIQTRSYQLEMLEHSLARNVIIAMDTGSGKTEIAVMRIRAELNRCTSDKRVWFLAPTVSLCEQQHRYIQSRLPDTSPLLLVGSSNLDCWSEQSIWDAVLHNHRIVISTHAILLDAMRHGFVRLTSLALLIFDEAHHCNGKHAANLIMQQFYHSEKKNKGATAVPHILGLSASPVRRPDVKEIDQIERNLDSVCVTPRIYRQELLAQVHHPEFVKIKFSEPLQPARAAAALCSLRVLCQKVTKDAASCLREVTLQHGSLIRSTPFGDDLGEQLIRTVMQYQRRSEHINQVLGSWAAECFIQETNKLCTTNTRSLTNHASHHDKIFDKVLAKHFHQPNSKTANAPVLVDHTDSLSDKAAKLVDLVAQQSLDTTGVIFVKERLVVSMLFWILSTHPRTAKRFTFATFVGLSNNMKKKNGIHELLDLESQAQSLEAFRIKQKQIIIATDVLEEGIDVAACNLVICFDPPPNLKSFVQRRGRARMQKSRFFIMQSCNNARINFDRWTQIEEEIIHICQDERRTRQAVLAVENEDEHLNLIIRDDSTGALLDADAIKAHLHHFCSTLPKKPFVETTPCFSILEQSSGRDLGLMAAKVILPNCVGSLPRIYSTMMEHRTERVAFQAASYECYKALREAELINGNLLPTILTQQGYSQDLAPLIVVDQHVQPWKHMAFAWSSCEPYQTTIQVDTNSEDEFSKFKISVITPVPLPAICWPTSKQDMEIALKQIDASVKMTPARNFEFIGKHEQTMAALRSTNESYPKNVANLDFVYIFGFGEQQDLLSHPRRLDIRKIMVRIIKQSEKTMIAEQLQASLLKTCTFQNNKHIVAALTAPSADPDINFERLEYLGDAVLKMVVSAQVFFHRVNWPAGWLSQYRDTLISNASLANAALGLHLDHYIMTHPSMICPLALPHLSDSNGSPEKRELSTKTLADVLQALFAAAYLDSGFNLARSCIRVFIPEIQAKHPTVEMPHGVGISSFEAEEVQNLIGYRFRNITILLQALTHPSCISHNNEESYQRLAFLGDAILGFLVAKALYLHGNDLSEGRMTQIRAAILNVNMLGYMCMTLSTLRKLFDIKTITPKLVQNRVSVETIPLWKYMRHESKDLTEAQHACNARYQQLYTKIQQQLQADSSYPWIPLAKLRPEEFFSDLIQSIVGAIYLDSREDWSACQRFLDTLGISSMVQRMIQLDYDVAHPRSVLQQLAPSAKVRNMRSNDGSFSCGVTFEEIEIVRVERCKSKNEASILASSRACEILLSEETSR